MRSFSFLQPILYTLIHSNDNYSFPPSHSGNPGIPGPRGNTGDTGLKGERGDTGLQGPPGNMSEVDMEHMKGEKGDIGEIGIKQHTGLWLSKSI